MKLKGIHHLIYKRSMQAYAVLFFLICGILYFQFNGSYAKDLSGIQRYSSISFHRENPWVPLKNNQKIDVYTRLDNKIFCGEVGCGEHPVKFADANTFSVWPGTGYAKDEKHVYKSLPNQMICVCGFECSACFNENPILPDADPATFRVIHSDSAVDQFAAYSGRNRYPF